MPCPGTAPGRASSGLAGGVLTVPAYVAAGDGSGVTKPSRSHWTGKFPVSPEERSMKTTTRVLVGGMAAGALAASLTAVAATSQTRSAPRASFGTPTVVDFFHPGYEPDLAVAKAGAYKGSTFVSVPNGFSTTMSYLWRSDDNRRSFHMTEGNALGKQATCVGGGAPEPKLDPVTGAVYFNDLQGLTNFTNSRSNDGGHTWDTSCTSVNGAGVDRQWIAIGSNWWRGRGGAGE